MSLNPWMSGSTASFSQIVQQISQVLKEADAVVIGAGAGLSAACGPAFAYAGPTFEAHFGDFNKRFGIQDQYSGGFYPFPDLETSWAWWSRAIWYARYAAPVGCAYTDLLQVVRHLDYFVLTTNVDHQFQRAGFDKNRLFYTQGDYGLWQCSVPCHQKTYDNYDVVKLMVSTQKEMRIPSELIPHCPNCGKPMAMNLRIDGTFVEDEGWHKAQQRYKNFLDEHATGHVVYLELGVGANTPGIIKYPFWQRVAQNKEATYIQINKGETLVPQELAERSLLFDGDAAQLLGVLAKEFGAEK